MGDQIDVCGDYGCGVDQCRDWCWICYCIGKLCLQWQLGGFIDCVVKQYQCCLLQCGVVVSEVLWCQFYYFVEVQGVQFVIKNEQCEGEEYVVDVGYYKCFYCCGVVFWIGVVEIDQQVRIEVYVFLIEVYQQQVIGQYQNYYVGDKQVGIGEEVGIFFFIVYVSGGEYVDQEVDVGNYGEYGQ